jgi:6-phosphogluconolactonase
MDDDLVLVGTYTAQGATQGIYFFRQDRETGELRPAGSAAVGANPSFLAIHPSRRFVYAVNEISSSDGRPTGGVAALALDAAAPALTVLGRRASGGAGPAYVSVDRTGRWALVANYGAGTAAALPIAADGALGDATAVVRHEGRGPRADRQEGPHAHCILADPSNRYVLVTDLGIDRVMVYRLDDRAGTLTPAPTPFAAVRPGAGPRHLAFHPTLPVLYVINELDLTVGAYRWDAQAGTLAELATVPAVSGVSPGGSTTGADVHLSPSGRFLYATVRGPNLLGVLAVDERAGTLTPVQQLPTGGDWPRNFGLDPRGRFLYAANQRSNDIVAFRVDEGTGRLTPTGHRVQLPSPVCVRFLAGPTG